MDAQALGLLIILVTGAFSFFIGRKLSARWRARKDAKRRAEREAAESRQVRRARQRSQKR
ncbi:hypothetical protein QTH91_22945 [Variovorax dokdonensis]|uniref:Uncharacterized protein n=1 Tax=Variovorax dokdonensis TaxID=344883 RepID=A0ABT7NHF3_9BURK|nr:hypothetical protein [Variovorax dokdonensis]MDM0047367.1 hypothetical protein [Variovorax dokdonensis]